MALATKTLDLAIRVHLVVLQDGHLDFLMLMLGLLGGLIKVVWSVLGHSEYTV